MGIVRHVDFQRAVTSQRREGHAKGKVIAFAAAAARIRIERGERCRCGQREATVVVLPEGYVICPPCARKAGIEIYPGPNG